MSIEIPVYQQQQQAPYQTTIITTNTLKSNNTESYLIVNVKELNLKIYSEIIVSWSIHEDTSLHDWIGLYKTAVISNVDHLDVHKLYSYNAAKIGHLKWPLTGLKLRNTHKIDDNDYVEFRYYSGLTNRLIAKSSSLRFIKYTIENELITCKITDIRGTQLRKGMFFNPDPYVKLYVLSTGNTCQPSHQPYDNRIREYKTSVASNTCYPTWKNDVFIFDVYESDKIILEVKDKFAKTKPSINRFLGSISKEFSPLINRAKLNNGKFHFSFGLSRRNSTNDTSVYGYISFMLVILTNPVQRVSISDEIRIYKKHEIEATEDVEVRQQEPEQQQSNSTRQCELANSPCSPQCQIGNLEQTSIGNVSQVNFDEPILLLTTSAIIVSDNQNDIDDPEPKHYMSLPNQKIQFDESSLGPIDQQIVVDDIEPHLETCQAKKPNLSRHFRSLKSSTNKYMIQKSKSKSMPDKLPISQVKTHQTNWQINSTPLPALASHPYSTTIESNQPDPRVQSPVLDDLIARLDDTPLAVSWQTASSNTQSASASSTDSLSDQTNEHQTHAVQAHTSETSTDARFELKPKQKCNSYTVLFDNGLSYDKNDPMMACQNTSRTYRSNGDREFFEDIGKELKEIAETIKNSKKNNVSYEKIQNDVQKTYIDKVLNRCKKHKHFHLIKSNSNKRLLNKRNSEALSSISLSVFEGNNHYRQADESLPQTANIHSSSTSICNNQPDANSKTYRQSFIKYNEQKQLNLIKTRSKEMLSMPEVYRSSSQQYEGSDQGILPSSSLISSIFRKNEITKTKSNRFLKKTTNQHVDSRLSVDNLENASETRIDNLANGGTFQDTSSFSVNEKRKGIDQEPCASSSIIVVDNTCVPPDVLKKVDNQNSDYLTSPFREPLANASKQMEANRSGYGHVPISQNGTQSASLSAISNADLPQFWEARVDHLGRIFYIDHSTRTTTWKKPQTSTNSNNNSNNNTRRDNSEIEKQRLDKRYQSIRRTINQPTKSYNDSMQITSFTNATACQQDSTNGIAQPKLNETQATATQTAHDPNLILSQPGVGFIVKTDFNQILKHNPDARELIKNSITLPAMIQKIRTNPSVYYRKYQHNKELVKFLNLFSDKARQMPTGWEMKFDKNNKVFFVDHNTRSTTFIDPRLPLHNDLTMAMTTIVECANTGPSGSMAPDVVPNTSALALDNTVQPLHKSHTNKQKRVRTKTTSTQGGASAVVANTSTISYSDRVVSFLQQPNLFDLIKILNVQLTAKQREKLTLIRSNGRAIYDRMAMDLDLAGIISQLEDSIMAYSPQYDTQVQQCGSVIVQQHQHHTTPTQPLNESVNINRASVSLQKKSRECPRSFHTKLRNFYRKLESKGYGQGPQKTKIIIKRDKLLEDAKTKFMLLSKTDLKRNKIFICFNGEEGLDYGGPAREFFFLLSRELFNPYYGLFEYSASDMYTVQISPISSYQEHAVEWFQFAGRVLAIALMHQYLLDAFFTRPFYKALLKDTNWSLSDLETLDPEYYQSLMWIKENDITDVLDLTFSVTEDKLGQIHEHDLKENGRNLKVTEKNKLEYIARLVKWRVERGVQKQTEALVKGFYEIIDPKLVQIFDARELELVLCGTIEIDLNDWKQNTEYRSGYQATHQVVIWFWQAVEKFDNEQKLKLLQFVTGTSSIPYEGFAALRGSNGLRKFCIERWGTPESLPRAHTCFNRLDLPPYSSYEILFDKLNMAIDETSGFAIQ